MAVGGTKTTRQSSGSDALPSGRPWSCVVRQSVPLSTGPC